MSAKPHWVGGIHAVEALLNSAPERILSASVTQALVVDEDGLYAQIRSMGVSVQTVDKDWLLKRVGHSQHQGIALQVRPKPELNESDLRRLLSTLPEKSDWLFLVLDQVQDPHNLGACLRTALAAGVDGVLLPKDRAAPISSVVHKVASGAADLVPVFRVTNLVRAVNHLQAQGVWVIGTSDAAEQVLYDCDLKPSLALMMGAEGRGLRQLSQASCDQLVALPMSPTQVSSLNVSVATGVCLYEAVRQRRLTN